MVWGRMDGCMDGEGEGEGEGEAESGLTSNAELLIWVLVRDGYLGVSEIEEFRWCVSVEVGVWWE